MPLSGMLTCGSCGTRTQMGSMRYNLGGNKLICPDCVDKERSSIKPGTTQTSSIRLREQVRAGEMRTQSTMTTRDSAEESPMPAEQVRAPSGDGAVNYYCRSCHYKFSRKRDIDVGSCPYCGRDSVSVAYGGKAQDLIEDALNNEEGLY